MPMYATLERPPGPQTPALDLAFAFGASRIPGREILFIALALAAHGALAFAVHGAPSVLVPLPQVTEIELPPPPEPDKVTPPPEAKEDPAAQPSKPSAAPPPQAARAGALLTAKDNAPSSKDEPLVDFVTDPNGTSYGSGVVARGGTADHGERGATAKGVGNAAAPPAAASPVGAGLTAAADLSRRASLSEANACAGFYPSEASADSGTVALTLVVRADGVVTSAAVVSESPPGQGFGLAARACLQRKRFEPSLDRAGTAVSAATTIRVRFVR